MGRSMAPLAKLASLSRILRRQEESRSAEGPRCNLNEYGIMLSVSRVLELLDYATNYGEFDQCTPVGTLSDDQSAVMTPDRRGAIVAYKRVLGIMRTPV